MTNASLSTSILVFASIQGNQLLILYCGWMKVTNRCPECLKGSIDLNLKGDGRWGEEWYAVDCDVGSSTLTYSYVDGSQY